MKILPLFLVCALFGVEEISEPIPVETQNESWKKEIVLLEKALEKEPDQTEYVYDLAHAYYEDGNLEKALEMFTKRISMGGSEEEIYHSLYNIGLIEEGLEASFDVVSNSYCKAYAYCPKRVEPIFRLAQYLGRKQNFTLGYALSKLAVTIPKPQEGDCLENWVYEYGALFELAHCSFNLGKMDEARLIYERLLKKELPEEIKEACEQNLDQILLCTQERKSGPKK